MDPHQIDEDSDADPDLTIITLMRRCGSDLTFHNDADLDPDPDPSFQIQAQTLAKVLK